MCARAATQSGYARILLYWCVDMGKCPNCQNSKWFLKTIECKVCGKEGCKECFIHLFQIVDKVGGFLDDWYACTKQCFDAIATRVENQISANEVSVDAETPIRFFVERVVFDSSNEKWLNSKILKKMAEGTVLHVLFRPKEAPWDYQHTRNALWKRLSRYTDIIKAKHYEKLREFENAVEIYKNLGMYKMAGKVRAKAEEIAARNMEREKQIDDYGRTIEKLTLLFSEGKMSEESYIRAIKTIEEKMNGKDVASMDIAKSYIICSACKKVISRSLKVCPYCGWNMRETISHSSRVHHVEKPTSFWYFAPLLFGLIGGLLGYVGVKDEDRNMADNLLGVGIMITFVEIFAIWVIYSRALGF